MQELINKRTQNSKHFLNDDGTRTAEISLRPIHFKDELGQYQDIELNIIPEQNWEFEYALRKNTFRAYFNDVTDLENYTLACFELINRQGISRWINYKLFGATPTGDSFNGNVFRYENVFPQIDLEYDVTELRLKEKIIVNSPMDSYSYTFTLKMDSGLRMELQPNNEIHFIDVDTEEHLWSIASPFAYDSANVRTENISYTFGKQNYNNIEYDSITVSLNDLDFLSNASFPLVIDPTVTLQPDGTAGKDTYINGYSPSTNYGINPGMAIGQYSTTPTRGLIQFDLSSISGTIASAQLRLNETSYRTGYVDTISIYRITQSWDETAVTWANAPTWDNSVLSSLSITNTVGFKTWTGLEQAIQDIVDGVYPNYGFMLKGTKETDNSNTEKTFASSDNTTAGNRPQLVITYNQAPTAPVLTVPNGGETWNAEHTITWIPATDVSSTSTLENIRNDTTIGNVSYTKIGQTITVDRDSFIMSATLKLQATVLGDYTIKLTGTDAQGKPNSTVYGSGTVTATTTGTQDFTLTLDQPLKLPIGTVLAIYVETPNRVNAVVSTGNRYSGGSFFSDSTSGIVFIADDDINFIVNFDEKAPTLQYQIQLSTDNGVIYSDVVELTEAEATSYTYDFNLTPPSTQSKVRIRAYDGYGYGPWDESDAVFTIQHTKVLVWNGTEWVTQKDTYVWNGTVFVKGTVKRWNGAEWVIC